MNNQDELIADYQEIKALTINILNCLIGDNIKNLNAYWIQFLENYQDIVCNRIGEESILVLIILFTIGEHPEFEYDLEMMPFLEKTAQTCREKYDRAMKDSIHISCLLETIEEPQSDQQEQEYYCYYLWNDFKKIAAGYEVIFKKECISMTEFKNNHSKFFQDLEQIKEPPNNNLTSLN